MIDSGDAADKSREQFEERYDSWREGNRNDMI